MTSTDGPTTPEERAEELVDEIRDHGSVNSLSWSASDDGAIVTCYAYVDGADTIRELAERSGFEVAHSHVSGDEVHYVFGYTTAEPDEDATDGDR